MKQFLSILTITLCTGLCYSQEVARQDVGTVYSAAVNDDKVNIHTLPSTHSPVIGQKIVADMPRIQVLGISHGEKIWIPPGKIGCILAWLQRQLPRVQYHHALGTEASHLGSQTS